MTLSMEAEQEHNKRIEIVGAEPFEVLIHKNADELYDKVVEQINGNIIRLRYGNNPHSAQQAIVKILLYYAALLYKKTMQINDVTAMLDRFELQLDGLMKG